MYTTSIKSKSFFTKHKIIFFIKECALSLISAKRKIIFLLKKCTG